MKKTIAILFGGKSAEHEISILSARNVVKNLDSNLYSPLLIFIDTAGGWYQSNEDELINGNFTTSPLHLKLESEKFAIVNSANEYIYPDAVFPVLHGPNGEDGSMQGLIEVAGLPYVGPGISGSTICMDKEIAKRLLLQAGIDVAKYVMLFKYKTFSTEHLINQIGLPLVVKPSRAGSSVGISKVTMESELNKAIQLAFQFDYKILIEEYIKGREIEVAVLGNENPVASIPGEIVTEFYDYHEKYSNKSNTKLEAPAKLSENEIINLQELAVKTFKALECEGMSRVDFFVTPNKILVNEVNTIPGFTNISMYPKLVELSGIKQQDLISRLIELAIKKQDRKNNLKSSIF